MNRLNDCVFQWPKTGFSQIAVVGLTGEKLTEIRTAIASHLGEDVAARISYFQPDKFLATLPNSPLPTPPPSTVKYIRGWKVVARYHVLSPEATKAREDALCKLMVQDIIRAKHNKPAR